MDKNYEIIDLDKEEIPEYCFKAIFLGDIGVGKTSIINYEINNKFDPNIESTTT
jgi:GTPase SAR1 family protein